MIERSLIGLRPITAEPVYYDIQGRRVNSPSVHGIYIVNGKKVMK
jgi:hypothetical protein